MVDFSDRFKPSHLLVKEFVAGASKVTQEAQDSGTADKQAMERLTEVNAELFRRTEQDWAERAGDPTLAYSRSMAEAYQNAQYYANSEGKAYAVYLRPPSDEHFKTHPFLCGEALRAAEYATEYGYTTIDVVGPQDNN